MKSFSNFFFQLFLFNALQITHFQYSTNNILWGINREKKKEIKVEVGELAQIKISLNASIVSYFYPLSL